MGSSNKLANTVLKAGLIAILAIVSFSCAQNKRDRGSQAAASSNTNGGNINVSTGSCPGGQSTVGMIYDNGNGFSQSLAAFVSSFSDPKQLGTVDGNPNSSGPTGIDFAGRWVTDSNGNIIQAQSTFQISIIDSYVGQSNGQGGTYGPITVTFNAGKYSHATCPGTLTGQVNKSNRTFTVTAHDCYGYIQFTGTYTDQYVDGVVKFQNERSAIGTQPYSGTLGGLRTTKCALLAN